MLDIVTFTYKFIVSLLITNASFANKADIADGLKRFFGEVKHEDIVKTPFNGVYEVILHNKHTNTSYL
jgi:hypothetical protein